MLGTTTTYKSVDSVNINRNAVRLACNTGTHVHHLVVECDTRTRTNTLGLMFVFPVTVEIDRVGNVTINNNYFGQFVKLSLKKG